MTLFVALLTMTTATAGTAEKKESKKNLTLYGEVYDSFSRGKVKAFVTLMNADSTVVDTTTCHTYERSTYSQFYFNAPREERKYIIKTEAEGYETKYTDYEVKELRRNSYMEIPEILMKRTQSDVYKDVDLEGVVVKGTRIQVAYRGDTIVYDASAFNLPEGSMLDGLIRQLPGAELKDNGDIYVNGKKIDYLTLNGKDFFKGDNKVMLENLPHFTVKNIKVYNKDTEKSEMMGKQMEKKDYVMDVVLKREYARGYLANAEVGAGTEDRWMAKLFGTYYDDHTRVSLFGNFNNVNETRTPGADGEWSPDKMDSGLQTTRQVGTNIDMEDKEKRIKNRLDVNVRWNDNTNEQRSFSETFTQTGSVFRRSTSLNTSKGFNFSATNNFSLPKAFFAMYTRVSVGDNKGRSFSADSTFNQKLVNLSTSLGSSHRKSLTLYNRLWKGFKLKSGDTFVFNLSTNYNNSSPAESFNNRRIFYAETGAEDKQIRHNDNSGYSYEFTPSVEYGYQLPNNWTLETRVKYEQGRQSTNSLHYRLEQMDEADFNTPGWLPSTVDALAAALDGDNSRTYATMQRAYTGEVGIYNSSDKHYFVASLPYTWQEEEIDYHYLNTATSRSRHFGKFTPQIYLSTFGGKRQISLNYSANVNPPSFYSLMPFEDTSNPLSRRYINEDIKNSVSHYANGRISFHNDSLGSSVYVGVNANVNYNSTGNRTVYNSTTGAYAYMTDNIDGNWSGGISTGWQRPLDRKKRFRMDISGGVDYQRSVDFASFTTSGEGDMRELLKQSPISKVNNVNLNATTKFTYRQEKLSVGITGKVASRHTRGDLDIVRDIDAVDFQYGWNATYTIPILKLTIATDMNMYSRRGYESSEINTNELVWNAQMSRSFLKGALTAKLQAFDILHDLSSTYYSVNAQGRSEMWFNCTPRYLMLALAYKFTRKPKKN